MLNDRQPDVDQPEVEEDQHPERACRGWPRWRRTPPKRWNSTAESTQSVDVDRRTGQRHEHPVVAGAAQLGDVHRHRLGPPEEAVAAPDHEQRDDDGPDDVDVGERVEGEPPGPLGGVVAEGERHPAVGDLVEDDRGDDGAEEDDVDPVDPVGVQAGAPPPRPRSRSRSSPCGVTVRRRAALGDRWARRGPGSSRAGSSSRRRPARGRGHPTVWPVDPLPGSRPPVTGRSLTELAGARRT